MQAQTASPTISLRAEAAKIKKDEFSAASDRLVALNVMQQYLDKAKQPLWLHGGVVTSRVASYSGAKVAGLIPVVGGMIEDADDALWQALQSSYEETYIAYIEKSIGNAWSKGQPIGGMTRDQARQKLITGTAIDAPAATAYVSGLLRDNSGDFHQLPQAIQNKLQNVALSYLARALDDTAALSTATAAELRKLKERAEKNGRALRTGGDREAAKARRNDLRGSLQGEVAQLATDKKATPLNDVEKAVKARLVGAAYMAETSNQLESLAEGFRGAGNESAARAAAKAAKAAKFVQSSLLVLAGDPLSMISMFTGAISLFGSGSGDPSVQVMGALHDLDKKIDAYHKEVMDQLGAMSLMLHELQSAAAHEAAGDTNACQTWLASATSLGENALVHDVDSQRANGTVDQFWPFYKLDAQEITSGLKDGQLKLCLKGLQKVFSRGDALNAAVQLPEEPASASAEPTNQTAAISKQWTLNRNFVVSRLSTNTKLAYLTLWDTAFPPTKDASTISLPAHETFLRFGRIYNPAAVARLGSYAAALHHFYPFSNKSSKTGFLVVQDALIATEVSLAQMHVLFGGPVVEIAVAALTDWKAFVGGRCHALLQSCENDFAEQTRKAVLDLLRGNTALRYNVATALLADHAKTHNIRPLSYSFAIEYATTTRDGTALLVFLGNRLPGGGRLIWKEEERQWRWVIMDIEFPFPAPTQISDGQYRFPSVYYELLRVGDQLATERATYELAPSVSKQALRSARLGVVDSR